MVFGIKCYLEVYIRALYQHSSYLFKLSLQYSSQYTEFHLEYVDYDLRTYDTLATHQRTSDSVQDSVKCKITNVHTHYLILS